MLPACAPTCLPVRLLSCLPSFLPSCLHACLPACTPACLPARLPSCLLACLPAFLPACLAACLPAWLLLLLFCVAVARAFTIATMGVVMVAGAGISYTFKQLEIETVSTRVVDLAVSMCT